LAALPQEILIVEAQLFQAGARYVGQLHLHFFRSTAGLTPFGDILYTAPRRLNHLVVRAAALADVAITKPDRHVKDKLRYLKALESPITAVLGNQRLPYVSLTWSPFAHGILLKSFCASPLQLAQCQFLKTRVTQGRNFGLARKCTLQGWPTYSRARMIRS
jgi:hypothetical protein